MRSLKIFGLLAVAAVALMAFAASASATTVTTTTGGAAVTPTLHAVNEGGNISIHNPEANIECSSELEGNTESHGSGVTWTLRLLLLKFTKCGNDWIVTVTNLGHWTIHWTKNHNGTVTWTGGTVTASFFFGLVTCRYATSNTHIGTITGGNPATLHLEGKLPFHSGSAACGTEPSQMTGDYVTTSALYVAP